MKKIAILFISLFTLSIIMSSCVSNKKCAAYGESSEYQRDRR